jgi:hypothetical protein
MIWEYTSVFPYLSGGGFIISDDIGWNLSFSDFARNIGEPVFVCKDNINFGALRKSTKSENQKTRISD